MMSLSGLQLVAVFLTLLVVILVVGFVARGTRHDPLVRQPDPEEPPVVVDPTGPYEVPEDDAPSRED
jgi:energy-converting hydrogenase Eha subunit F